MGSIELFFAIKTRVLISHYSKEVPVKIQLKLFPNISYFHE